MGAQDTFDGVVTWSTVKTFDPTTGQLHVDTGDDDGNIPNGRYMAVRFQSNSNLPWQLEGYNIDFALLGTQGPNP